MRMLFVIPAVFLASCYKQLSLEGFDKEKWAKNATNCDEYRLRVSNDIIQDQEELLGRTQNEIESLFGKSKEHELYKRNQKFFHYRLTPPDECGQYETLTYLSVRFNAIGRANMVQIMLRTPNN